MSHESNIRKGAAEIARLHRLIHECYGENGRKDEWRRACTALYEGYDTWAFPGGLDAGMSALKKGDLQARNAAILFLEIDPMFFRSGYIKEEIIRRLKQFDLTSSEVDRVHSAVLRVVKTRSCRELRQYRSLARRFATSALVEALRNLANDADPATSQRARWVLRTVEE